MRVVRTVRREVFDALAVSARDTHRVPMRVGVEAGDLPGVETKKKARPKRDAPSNKIVWQLLVGLSL